MLTQGRYPEVHLAPRSVPTVLQYGKKVSGKAIKAALAQKPELEFIDALTGQYLTVAEAKKLGVRSLNVRYNGDRDVAVIPVK
jgi:hypothetical protein